MRERADDLPALRANRVEDCGIHGGGDIDQEESLLVGHGSAGYGKRPHALSNRRALHHESGVVKLGVDLLLSGRPGLFLRGQRQDLLLRIL